jgi:serine/threonine-protein kinase
MPLLPGSRLGVYEVTAQIGEGGMGQVYRATDTSLKRQVAIKVLPEGLASDPDRLARFQREAEVLASLNHPNIAAIHGLERSGGVNALVMELVEGEDLSQRISRLRAPGASAGQAGMPLDEALPIAKQIAEALEAAHEQGIVHRDLKPANVKVRPDGAVKVLDFGLAKALDQGSGIGDRGSGNLANSPTITTPAMTQMGMILGTAAYMAPEQARGKVVDRRADIWAFGALLFEMLTGRRAFEGDDLSITLATVMMKEPDWTALPAGTPPGIQRLLRRCLVKDPRQRIRDMGDVRLALDEALDEESGVRGSAQPLPPPAGATRAATIRRVAAFLAVATGAAALAGGGVWITTRPLPPRVSRTTITGSGPAALWPTTIGREIAITPDGSRVVYVGNQGRQIFVRALDALEPTAIASGTTLTNPFVSPDGQWVGFVESYTRLRKVAISGGPAITVATLDGGVSRGATWLADDTIVIATNTSPAGLQRVPASGGAPSDMTRPDPARGEADHLFPEALPGGRAVLFTISSRTGGSDASSVAVYDLDTNTQTVVMPGGSHAQFVPGRTGSLTATGGDGHLVFVAAGTLRAVPFDPVRRVLLGPAVPAVSRLITTSSGAGDFAVALDGTLVYADSGGANSAAARTLVWVDRAGKEEPIAVPPRLYNQVRSSPDGTRLALSAGDQEGDIWVWDLRRQTLTRVTFDPTSDTYPLWTADSRRIVYTSQRGGPYNLWWQAADGSGTPERLTTYSTTQAPTGLAPDGTVIFHQVEETMGRDLMGIALDGSKKITPFLQTQFDERDAVVSPDGRWLAFSTDSSGRSEVYVRPFPNTSAGQWQISTTGGRTPLWSRDGKELFFFGTDGALMAAKVEAPATAWNAGQPVQLFGPRYDAGTGTGGRTYDFSADGKRFVMIKLASLTGVPPSIIVVQNFSEELKRVAPNK